MNARPLSLIWNPWPKCHNPFECYGFLLNFHVRQGNRLRCRWEYSSKRRHGTKTVTENKRSVEEAWSHRHTFPDGPLRADPLEGRNLPTSCVDLGGVGDIQKSRPATRVIWTNSAMVFQYCCRTRDRARKVRGRVSKTATTGSHE